MPTARVHAGSRRPGGAFVAAFLATCVTALVRASSAAAQTPEERCLLEALRAAAPHATVGELRAGCTEPRAPETRAFEPARVAPPAPSKPVDASPVRRRIEEEGVLWGERFALLPHRPNYLLPFSHSLDAPGTASGAPAQRNEVKFQISFKFPLTPPLHDGRLAVFFAYTGQSWWQAWNSERSSPFREYSHEPEVFASWAPAMRLFGWDWRVASAGFVHQSNGRSGEFSRSWDRLFAEMLLDRPGPWWIGIRPWWRIPESMRLGPRSSRGDDNPDLTRYAGHGELRAGYAGGSHNWTLTMRRSLSNGGKGAVQLDYSRPTGFSPNLRWHVQYFDGYGENLLDYRSRMRRIGVGVMLNDWY